MADPNEESFKTVWPRCFIIFMGIIEALAFLVLIFTELGNVAASFWTTNVFAGGWCGIIILIHFIALFVVGCCKPKPKAAFVVVIITIIALVACAALIGFDSYFIAQPNTCILTPSCTSNVNSTSIFSYTFQTGFFTAFNTLGPFKTYTQSQAKFLFQTVQLGVGCLCFVLCIIFLIIYYVSKSKSSKRQVRPSGQQGYNAPQPNYQQPAPAYQQPAPAYRQPAPGEQPWNPNRRY